MNALGHDEIEHDAQVPTCTEIGWDAYVTCSRCDYSTYNEIPATGHIYDNNCDSECNECDAIRTAPHTDNNNDGLCDDCDEFTPEYLSKFTGTLNDNGESYIISNVDTNLVGNITLPSEYQGKPVTAIGSSAFSGCSNLTSIVIPDSVTSIGAGAFSGCSSLESITIPFVGATKDGTEDTHFGYIFGASSDIYNEKYVPTSLKAVNITGGTTIGKDAFYFCDSITSITIPSSVTTIGYSAFYGCKSLTSITIPSSVTTIGDIAFCYCYSLTSITIPASVTSIGSSAFGTCKALAEVYNYSSLNITKGSSDYGYVAYHALDVYTTRKPSKLTTDENGFVIHTNGDVKTLVRYNGTATEITIPSSVTTIGSGAFVDCNRLTSIVIPDSVTTIGSGAFYNCSKLTSIVIPDSVTTIGEGAFMYCDRLTSITIPFVGATKDGTEDTHFGYIFGASSFSDNGDDVPTSLKAVNITGGTTIVGYAFYNCDSLTSVTIGDSVTTIGGFAFGNCDSLTSVTIGDSVTTIGRNAFYGCTSLTSVTFEDRNGWYRTKTEGATSGTNLTLTNASTNANYLKSTYCEYYWYKK